MAYTLYSIYKEWREKSKYITKGEINKEIISFFNVNSKKIKEDAGKMPRFGEEHFLYSYEVLRGDGSEERYIYLESKFKALENKGGYLENYMKPFSKYTICLTIAMSTMVPTLNAATKVFNSDEKMQELIFRSILAFSLIVLGFAFVYFIISIFVAMLDHKRKEKDRRFYVDKVMPKVIEDMREERRQKQDIERQERFIQGLREVFSQKL